jgi:hypothetical protein
MAGPPESLGKVIPNLKPAPTPRQNSKKVNKQAEQDKGKPVVVANARVKQTARRKLCLFLPPALTALPLFGCVIGYTETIQKR